MEAIVLTEEEKNKLFTEIDIFYRNSPWRSFETFKLVEYRNIVTVAINNDLHLLSSTFLTDSAYNQLRVHLLSKMELNVRGVLPHEIPVIEDI